MTIDGVVPLSAPSQEGIDPAGIDALLDALEADPAIEPHSLTIVRHGRVVAEGWWAPYDGRRPYLLYSLSKSFTASALAVAVGEGLVDLDVPVLHHFPEIPSESVPPRVRKLLLRHIVSMRSGHRHETIGEVVRADPDDPVRAFLNLPPEDDPGTTFAYNQPPVSTVAEILRRVTGQTLTEYLRPRLYEPLGIDVAAWQRDARGLEVAFSGLFTRSAAIARLGELYLRDGVWDGRRLLPEGWVQEASRPHADTSNEPTADWQQGYGFGFWMGTHGYRGDGAWGQYCLILPDQDAVVVLTSATGSMQRVLDAVWCHLLPAFDHPVGPASPADARLGDRLAALQLPPAAGTSWQPDTSGWPMATFAALGGRCDAQRSLSEVRVEADGRVVLVDDGTEHVVRLGAAPPDAIAVAAAGWTDGATFVLDLVFVQSPHRLWVVGDRRNGTFTAGWATTPLSAPTLTDLAAPAG